MSSFTLLMLLLMSVLFYLEHWLHLYMLHVAVAHHWQGVACKLNWGVFS